MGKAWETPYERYSANPVISGRTWASVLKRGDIFIMYYTYFPHKIGRAVSNDGIHWTVTHEPVIPLGASGEWDSGRMWCPMVWFENGEYKMLYSADRGARPIKVGLATSPDGINWTKYAGNPVLSPSQAWEGDENEGWGLIKVGNTYYLWYGRVAPTRAYGLATSTDLKSWTKDPNNPIFDGNRFCPDVFKVGDYYYILIPHYTSGTDYSNIELYRCRNPTFYPDEREYLGVALPYGQGAWNSLDQDTPWVLADDITKSSFNVTNNRIYIYHAGNDMANTWHTGLAFVDVEGVQTPPFPIPEFTSFLDYAINVSSSILFLNIVWRWMLRRVREAKLKWKS